MAYAALILLAACIVLGFLLVCALVGYSEMVDQLRARLDRRDAEVEDLTNELRHQARDNHPAGRRFSDTPIGDEAEVIALREALERRGADYPWDAS